MGRLEEVRDQLAAKFAVLFPHLDERQRRLLMGAGAQILGMAGSGPSRGRRATGQGPPLRRRSQEDRRGGSGLRSALLALVEPEERGDPMSPLRWTTKSTRKLAQELTGQGHRVSADTVGDLLREEGSVCRATPRRSRASSTLTVMPNSVTSMSRPAPTGMGGTR